MSRLVLHIGMPKTGSSAIQRFLADNQDRLEQHGVAFPVFIDTFDNDFRANADILRQRLAQCVNACENNTELPAYSSDYTDFVNRMHELSRTRDLVILSSELFFIQYGQDLVSEQAQPNFFNHDEQFQQFLLDELAQFPFERIDVVVYLRRPDLFSDSWYKQEIENSGVPDSVESVCNSWSGKLHYNQLFTWFERTLPSNWHLVLRVFEKEKFSGGDIFHDFCEAINLPWDEAFSLPGLVNPSLSCDVVEALKRINPYMPLGSAPRNKGVLPLAYQLTREYPDSAACHILSYDQAATLLSQFEDDYQAIAKRSFGREELFEPLDKDSYCQWEPNAQRIAQFEKMMWKAAYRVDPLRTLINACIPSTSPLRRLGRLLPQPLRKLLGGTRERADFESFANG